MGLIEEVGACLQSSLNLSQTPENKVVERILLETLTDEGLFNGNSIASSLAKLCQSYHSELCRADRELTRSLVREARKKDNPHFCDEEDLRGVKTRIDLTKLADSGNLDLIDWWGKRYRGVENVSFRRSEFILRACENANVEALEAYVSMCRETGRDTRFPTSAPCTAVLAESPETLSVLLMDRPHDCDRCINSTRSFDILALLTIDGVNDGVIEDRCRELRGYTAIN